VSEEEKEEFFSHYKNDLERVGCDHAAVRRLLESCRGLQHPAVGWLVLTFLYQFDKGLLGGDAWIMPRSASKQLRRFLVEPIASPKNTVRCARYRSMQGRGGGRQVDERGKMKARLQGGLGSHHGGRLAAPVPILHPGL
jgi:hypothetical protein